VKGVIFDMDNTLLRSRIDFVAMKREIAAYLAGVGVLGDDFPLEEHTSSTIIEYAKMVDASADVNRTLLSIASDHEVRGMEDAGLEPGVKKLLELLYKKYTLVVVTNNALAAVHKALELTGVLGYFDLVVGREQMSAMKPSPSGVLYALERFRHLPSRDWISVGDSWIDGRAAHDAGVPFICYGKSREQMLEKGVEPLGCISRMLELTDYLGTEAGN
jgi:phosphoglycolate phosphatase